MTTDQLVVEKAKLEKQMSRAQDQYAKASRRLTQVETSLRLIRERNRLAPLVGVPNGVKYATRTTLQDEYSWMNDALGTLLEIRRSCVSVDYGERGKWDLRVYDVIPADGRQGVTFAAMAKGDMPDDV